MNTHKKAALLILLASFCFVLFGCSSTMEKVEKADMWMEDNMW